MDFINYLTLSTLRWKDFSIVTTTQILIFVLSHSLIIVDFIILGYLGKGHLSAGILGNAYFNLIWSFIKGFLSVQFNLMKISSTTRYWTYISLLYGIILSFIGSILMISSGFLLGSVIQIKFHTSSKAWQYLVILIPALWLQTITYIIQNIFKILKIEIPLLNILLVGNLVNLIGKSSN